jgi:hypothetical protein
MNALDRVFAWFRYRGKPSGEFWRALLFVRNEYKRVAPHMFYPAGEARANPYLDAIQLIDCWLDLAIDHEWLD